MEPDSFSAQGDEAFLWRILSGAFYPAGSFSSLPFCGKTGVHVFKQYFDRGHCLFSVFAVFQIPS